jgi:FkbM family methyltransferase
LKLFAKRALQQLFGFHHYMLLHSIFVAVTLRFRPNEGAMRNFIDRLPVNATVIDAGANVGTMTLLFAKHCSQGKVYAFEPIPSSFAVLKAIVHLFRLTNVIMHEVALGDRPGKLEMVLPVRDGVIMEGLAHVIQDYYGDSGVHATVPCCRLDDFFSAETSRIDGIKIDVEDWEKQVLYGARQIIERHRPIIFAELWHPEHRQEVIDFLRPFGYVMCHPDGRSVLPGTQPPLNVLFVLPGGGIFRPADPQFQASA